MSTISHCILALILSCLVTFTLQSPNDPSALWKQYNIYQIITDRFSTSTLDKQTSCSDLRTYCGGTWMGIKLRLPYIKKLGFNAIWISPIVKQIDIPSIGYWGYHGYWSSDLFQVNPHFGTEQDLMDMVNAAHGMGIAVIVDVVANHVGPLETEGDFSKIITFSSPSYYHNKCDIQNWNNQTEVEICRLANLPDLDQKNDYVRSTLNRWITTTLNKYKFDGVRIDTVPEVNNEFWTEWRSLIGEDRYVTGEVFNGDVNYVAGYANVLGATLSYPLYFTLLNVFANGASMFQIRLTLNAYAQAMKRPDLLSTFIDNHDNARFLNHQGDVVKYKNALTYVIFAQGIPIIYYGTEQAFHGGADPNNREIMFNTFVETSEMYRFLQVQLKYKNHYASAIAAAPHVERYVTDLFYAFSRDKVFVATTNVGGQGARQTHTITYHPYANGDVICDIFWGTGDCVTVQGGSFNVVLLHGESKVFVPKAWLLSED